MTRVIYTIIFTIIISLLFNALENKSNIPNEYIVPLITSGIIKYIIGDWDVGSKLSYTDILYFVSILTISFIITKIFNSK